MAERKILHSWKDIAKYIGRGLRTVQRYEEKLGLPVHRPAGTDRSAVLAFSDELDARLSSAPTRAAVPAHPVADRKLTEAQVQAKKRFSAIAAEAKRNTQEAKRNTEEAKRNKEAAIAAHKVASAQAKRVNEMFQKFQTKLDARHKAR